MAASSHSLVRFPHETGIITVAAATGTPHSTLDIRSYSYWIVVLDQFAWQITGPNFRFPRAHWVKTSLKTKPFSHSKRYYHVATCRQILSLLRKKKATKFSDFFPRYTLILKSTKHWSWGQMTAFTLLFSFMPPKTNMFIFCRLCWLCVQQRWRWGWWCLRF